MKIDIVDFTNGGDGVTAVYVDGKLHRHGDPYHDSITQWIDGFVAGLKFAKVKVKVNKVYLAGDNQWVARVSEDGDLPPKKLKDLE